jgi:hypothetical protein
MMAAQKRTSPEVGVRRKPEIPVRRRTFMQLIQSTQRAGGHFANFGYGRCRSRLSRLTRRTSDRAFAPVS